MSRDIPLPPADETWNDAPLFHLFWQNGALNPARAAVMGQRIARDAPRPGGTPAPQHRQATWPLASPAAGSAPGWEKRSSTRTFGADPATLQELGLLLYPLRGKPDSSTRLLPSGGAKYPIQTYVALNRVEAPAELAGHIAWYDNTRHGLTPVRPCPSWQTLAPILGVDWQDEPAAVVFMVARPETMLAKYGERGGRFMLLEAGTHLGALSHQIAQADWAGCAIGSFQDDALLALLGLSAPSHLAVLAYACGPRRPD